MMKLTTDQLDDLWEAINNSRTHSKTVKVDKAAVSALLSDYHKMYDEITLTPDMREERWTRK